jgi:hypothetical protein
VTPYRLTDIDMIVCAGRALDDTGKAVGKPCGAKAFDSCMCCQGWCSCVKTADRHAHLIEHLATMIQWARAAGWRIGPLRDDQPRDAMCPRCARPDPVTVQLCRDLAKQVLL